MNTIRTHLTNLLFWLIRWIGFNDPSAYTKIVRWSRPDNAYVATAPAFPGASGIGDSAHEAVYELGVAVDMMLDIADEDGTPYPNEGTIVQLRMGQPIAYAENGEDNRE